MEINKKIKSAQLRKKGSFMESMWTGKPEILQSMRL